MLEAALPSYARSSSWSTALGESSRHLLVRLLYSGRVRQGWFALEGGGAWALHLVTACLLGQTSSVT